MAVEIKYESPSQRRHYRVTTPILLEIEGVTYEAKNWSLSGFKIEEYHGVANVGDSIYLRVRIPFQGFDISFMTHARVVRRQQQQLAAEFAGLDEREYEILKSFVTGLVGGEMEEVAGVIRRLDVPVTPASLKPDKKVTEAQRVEEIRKRARGGRIYAAAGVVLTLVLLVIIYTNIFQLKTDSAIVYSPTEMIYAPTTAGDVSEINVDELEYVSEGEPLITFTDPRLEHDIELARYRAREASAAVTRARGSVMIKADENNHSSEIKAAVATVATLEAKLRLQQAAVARARSLYQQTLMSKTAFDNVQNAYFQVEQELHKAKQEANRLSAGLDSNLQLEEVAENELKLLEARRERLTIKAPADGRVLKLFVSENGGVQYGKPALLFEYASIKETRVFLTQKEALSINLRDHVSVYLPVYGIYIDERVKEIDPVTLVIDDKSGSYTGWIDNSNQKTVLVKLEPRNDEEKAKLAEINQGSAVVATINKRPLRRFFKRLIGG